MSLLYGKRVCVYTKPWYLRNFPGRVRKCAMRQLIRLGGGVRLAHILCWGWGNFHRFFVTIIGFEDALSDPLCYRKKCSDRVANVWDFARTSEFRDDPIVGAIGAIPLWSRAYNRIIRNHISRHREVFTFPNGPDISPTRYRRWGVKRDATGTCAAYRAMWGIFAYRPTTDVRLLWAALHSAS